MDITCEPLPSEECVPNQEILDVIQSNDFVNDDFKREMQLLVGIKLPLLDRDESND